MKKLLSTIALGSVLASGVNADFLRVEAGGGIWSQTPKGYATRTDGDGVLKLDGTYTSDEKSTNDNYVWLLLKHPLPIIPNLRLEYATITDKGKTSGKIASLPTIPATAETTMDITEYDVIPYYNLLDNTFWTTIDLGIDIKIIQSDVNVENIGMFPGYTSTDTTPIPLLYLRGRVQIPTTGIGLEADGKAITDGTNTFYDARAKIDYTFDFVPVVQPGIEVGYRIQKLRVDDGTKSQIDLEYSGVYGGIMLRF
jgi:outer membrane protein